MRVATNLGPLRYWSSFRIRECTNFRGRSSALRRVLNLTCRLNRK